MSKINDISAMDIYSMSRSSLVNHIRFIKRELAKAKFDTDEDKEFHQHMLTSLEEELEMRE